MSKHCTTLLVAVGLALVLGDSARAEDGVGKSMTAETDTHVAVSAKQTSHSCAQPGAIGAPSATAEKPTRHKTTLNDPLFDPQIGRTFRDNTGA